MFSRLNRFLVLLMYGPIVVFVLLSLFRNMVEARYVPSTSMSPNIQPNDRIILEKVSKWSGDFERGSIIVFYPPPLMYADGVDPPNDLPHIMGRLTGLPFFPNQMAIVKRVIGVAGDKIEVGAGVSVNGKLIEEPYARLQPPKERHSYKTLGDLGGPNIEGEPVFPYPDQSGAIVVPDGKLFVLSDDRAAIHDSRTFGFVDKSRVIGRAWQMVYPKFEYMRNPGWVRH